jgi:hypothetical protein
MAVVVGLAVVGFALVAVFTAFAILFKILLRLVLLPLFLLKWIVMALVMLVVGPVLFVAGVVAVFALAIPLLPFVAVAAIIWLLVRSNGRQAVA